MTAPTWESIGQQAINSLPTWDKYFTEASMLITLRLKIVSVEASGWALGKSAQEIESEAKRRLMEGE